MLLFQTPYSTALERHPIALHALRISSQSTIASCPNSVVSRVPVQTLRKGSKKRNTWMDGSSCTVHEQNGTDHRTLSRAHTHRHTYRIIQVDAQLRRRKPTQRYAGMTQTTWNINVHELRARCNPHTHTQLTSEIA